MKKFLTYVFSICLILPCLFILSACSNAPTAQSLVVAFADENKVIENNTLIYTYGDTIDISNEVFKVSVLLSNTTVREISHKTTDEQGKSVDGYVKETNLPKLDKVPAGEYYVKFTYGDLEAVELSIIVKKAQIDMSNVKWNYSKLTYNGQEQSVELINLPENITVSYTGNTGTIAQKYTAVASFEFDRDNYELKNSNITNLNWEINKCPINLINVKWDYTTPFEFDGKDKTVELINVPDNLSITYTNNIKTFAGTYTATAKLTYDKQNYDLVNNNIKDCTWTINKTSVIVKNLTEFEDALENNSYDKIIVDENIDITKQITISEEKVIIVNSGALLTTITNLTNNGEIIVNVGNIEAFTSAIEYANKIILVENLTPEQNEDSLIVISATNKTYKFDLDLAGYSIGYNLEFNNKYTSDGGATLRTNNTCNINIMNSTTTISYIGHSDNNDTDIAINIDINVEYSINIITASNKLQLKGITNIVNE